MEPFKIAYVKIPKIITQRDGCFHIIPQSIIMHKMASEITRWIWEFLSQRLTKTMTIYICSFKCSQYLYFLCDWWQFKCNFSTIHHELCYVWLFFGGVAQRMGRTEQQSLSQRQNLWGNLVLWGDSSWWPAKEQGL